MLENPDTSEMSVISKMWPLIQLAAFTLVAGAQHRREYHWCEKYGHFHPFMPINVALCPVCDVSTANARRTDIPYINTVVLKLIRLGTPQIILFEVGTPLYLFDSIPQRNIVKIADLKAHNASRCEALRAFRSAIFTYLICGIDSYSKGSCGPLNLSWFRLDTRCRCAYSLMYIRLIFICTLI